MSLRAIHDRRILIVGGSGGVGKTSTAAAIGILCATSGYRTLVLTIDPARRLAAALGLSGIGKDPVDVGRRLPAGTLPEGGSLHAMMLDVQNTFDRVVERYAPDEVTRQRILGNRLYKNISTRLSGSQEYASMQRLYEIAQEGVYDRIVLDTPPTTHALDFLMAPHRLTEFFDSRVMQLFISFGGRVGWGLLRRSTDVFFKAVDRLTGAGLVGEIADFFRIAETILEPYRSQAGETERLLRSADTTFFVVTGPNAHQIDDARKFRETLGAMGISVSAVIVNRVLGETLPPDASLPQPQHNDALADEAAEWGARLELLARAQTAATRSLDSEQADVALVPQFDEDVHSLEGLMKIEAALRSE